MDRRRLGAASGSTIHPALIRDDAGGRDIEVAAKVVPYGQDAFLKQQILKEAQIYKVSLDTDVAAKGVPYGQDAFMKQQILKEAQIYKGE